MKEFKNHADVAFRFLITKAKEVSNVSDATFVFRLKKFRQYKGDEALCKLAGFYIYAKMFFGDNKEKLSIALNEVFSHDLNGAEDKFMLPKSDEYIDAFEGYVMHNYVDFNEFEFVFRKEYGDFYPLNRDEVLGYVVKYYMLTEPMADKVRYFEILKRTNLV